MIVTEPNKTHKDFFSSVVCNSGKGGVPQHYEEGNERSTYSTILMVKLKICPDHSTTSDSLIEMGKMAELNQRINEFPNRTCTARIVLDIQDYNLLVIKKPCLERPNRALFNLKQINP